MSSKTPLAVIEFDLTGRVRQWNPAAVATFGFSREEAIGQYWTFIVPAAIHAQLEGVWAAIVGRHGGSRSSNENITKDGRKIHCEWFNTPLVDPAGRTVGVASLIQDITERKQAEEKVRLLNAGLEQRVRDRTAELEAANKELEAFSYSVSHDLRAPLRTMDGFSMALLEDYAGKLGETAQHYLRRIRAGSQQMAVLIDDLLNLSQLTRMEMQRQRVDLTAMAKAVGAELQRMNPERVVELAVAPGLAADVDSRMVRVVLNNLLGNAWKFTSRRAPARIEVGVRKQDGESVFFVRDNGAGFDMAYAGKLFGAFQRLHSASEFEGNGIGLALVQRIVHRHGGRVWAEGAVGQGATFYFKFGKERD